MGFRRVAPQIFQHTNGYCVQVGSRTTMEYIEGSRKAVVEVEFGTGTTCIYVQRVVGWVSNGRRISMTDEERGMTIERIAAALQFDGSSVEMSTR
jgi:hypothetical protein